MVLQSYFSNSRSVTLSRCEFPILSDGGQRLPLLSLLLVALRPQLRGSPSSLKSRFSLLAPTFHVRCSHFNLARDVSDSGESILAVLFGAVRILFGAYSHFNPHRAPQTTVIARVPSTLWETSNYYLSCHQDPSRHPSHLRGRFPYSHHICRWKSKAAFRLTP